MESFFKKFALRQKVIFLQMTESNSSLFKKLCSLHFLSTDCTLLMDEWDVRSKKEEWFLFSRENAGSDTLSTLQHKVESIFFWNFFF